MKTIASTALPAHVQQPRYDREQLRSRIVHFGFGAFHRAHQALLTNRVLNARGGDWGICEISLFSGDVLMRQLRAQDHLFTVLEKGAEGNQPIIIGAVKECLNAKLDSLAAIIEKFCEPQVAIVSSPLPKKATASIRRRENWICRTAASCTILSTRLSRIPRRVFWSKRFIAAASAACRRLPCSPATIFPTTATW